MHTVSVSIPLTIELSLDSPTVVAELVSDDLVVPARKGAKVVSVDMGHAADPIKVAPAKVNRKPAKRAMKPTKAKAPKTVRQHTASGFEIERPAHVGTDSVRLATVIAVREGAEKFGEILAKTGAKKSSQRVALAKLKKAGQLFSAGTKADMVYGITQQQADKRFENRKASAAQAKQLKAA